MKNRFIGIVILVLALSFAFTLGACSPTQEQETMFLSAPTNITLDKNVLAWEGDERAVSHTVIFGEGTSSEQTFANAESPLSLPTNLPSGFYLVKIRAEGNGTTLMPSESGLANYFVYAESRPAISVTNGILTSTEEGSYEYAVDDGAYTALGSGLNLSTLTAPCKVNVIRKGNGKNIKDSSPYELSVQRRAAPASVSISADEISWSPVSGVSSYMVKLFSSGNEVFSRRVTGITKLDPEITSAGNYTTHVIALGTDMVETAAGKGSVIIDSNYEDGVKHIVLSGADTPIISEFKFNSLTYSMGANSASVFVELFRIYNEEEYLISTKSSTTSSATISHNITSMVGEYYYRLVARGVSGTLDSVPLISNIFTVTEVGTPVVELSASEGVTWTAVSGALGYSVSYDVGGSTVYPTVSGTKAEISGGLTNLPAGKYTFTVMASGRAAHKPMFYEKNSVVEVGFVVGELDTPVLEKGDGASILIQEVDFAEGYAVTINDSTTVLEGREFSFADISATTAVTISAIGTDFEGETTFKNVGENMYAYSQTSTVSTTIYFASGEQYERNITGGVLEISGLAGSSDVGVEVSLIPTESFRTNGTILSKVVVKTNTINITTHGVVPSVYTVETRTLGGASYSGGSFYLFTEQTEPSVALNVFVDGNGEEYTPKIIQNETDFLAIVSGKCYFQRQSFSLSVGSQLPDNFEGSYNGNGMSLNGLKMPLVNTLSVNGVIENLELNADISYTDGTVGAVARENDGEIINVTVSGKVSSMGDRVGGLVGVAKAGSRISYSTNNAEVSGKGMVGGVAGYAEMEHSGYKSIITRTVNHGRITGTGGAIGGLVGVNRGDIILSVNYGTVQKTGDGETTVEMRTDWLNHSTKAVGGLVGALAPHVPDKEVGGYIGSSYNLGSVTGTGIAGGVYGESYGRFINNCYNAGTVSGSMAGGIAGNSYGHEGKDGSVISCVSFGTIALFGDSLSNELVLTDTVTLAKTAMAQALVVLGDQFVEETTENTLGLNNGYPLLKWQIGG